MEPSAVPDWLRRATIGGLFIAHIQFAALLIGIIGLGVFYEIVGMFGSSRSKFDRTARGLALTGVVGYSTGAVLAIITVFILNVLWPTFWYVIVRITFWPFFLEALTFALTILYIFPWYYTWGLLGRFKLVHVSIGVATFVVVMLQQSMIDVAAAYMLTPATPANLLRVFFSATTIPLDMHRIVGDISFAGFVVAGYAAVKTLRARDDEQRAFFDWVGNAALIAGLGFLFLQPAIGVEYVMEIRQHSPGVFYTMMAGRLSSVFLLQVTFLSSLFLLSMLYIILQTKKSRRAGVRFMWGLLVIAGLAALLLVQPFVIGPSQVNYWVNWTNPIGSMQPFKYIALAVLTLSSIGIIFGYTGPLSRGLRWGYMGDGGRSAQRVLLALAILASLMMILMGVIRENSRQPYLIYPEFRRTLEEQFPPLPPPSPTPGDISSHPPTSGLALNAEGSYRESESTRSIG